MSAETRSSEPSSEADTLQADPPPAPAPRASETPTAGPSHDPGAAHARARVRASLFDLPPPATRIGRFMLVDQIGEGGMGTVFLARDTELDREVALKLLHTPGGKAGERLLREARAMARLTHPNVVTVYEAGTAQDQVYLAMELVRGQDLQRWLEQGRRRWREVVRLLVQAADGLVAAHQTGMVHRDFKPANVLVDESGVAKVADFGLARASASSTESIDPSIKNTALATLTRTGAIMGTPAYLPPEIIDGRGYDERGDQFSFCVTAFEAIYGRRPFGGQTLGELANNIYDGRVASGSFNRRAPRAIRRILVRGLSAEPNDRFESMGALARALVGVLDRRRRLLVGVGTLAFFGLPTAALLWSPTARSVCTGSQDAWAQTWSPEVREEVTAAVLATGHPAAAAVSARVTDLLDTYGTRWVEAHQQACEATHVRQEQSVEVLDQQMSCLDVRRSQAHSLVELLRVADHQAVGRASRAVRQLPRIDACRGAPQQTAPLPDDPQLRQQVEALRQRIADARARQGLGYATEAHERYAAIRTDADAAGYVPLMVDIRLEQAQSNSHSEPSRDLLFEALHMAEADGYVDGQRMCWTALASQLPYLGEYEAADRAAAHAEAFVAQTGNDPGQRAALLNARAFNKLEHSEHDEAVGLIDEAVRLLEDKEGYESDLVMMLGGQGTIYTLAGRDRDALAPYERAYRMSLELEGRTGETAFAMMNLGRVHKRLGDSEASSEWYRRSISLYEALGSAKEPPALIALNNLGRNLAHEGKYDEAIEAIERAIAGRVEQLGGTEHRSLVRLRRGLAQTYRDAGRLDEAVAKIAEALAVAEKTFGLQHDETARTRTLAGQILWKAGQRERGLALLELAIEDPEGSGITPHHLAMGRYALFRVLVEDPAHHERTRSLARQALAVLSEFEDMTDKADDLRTWLAQHEGGESADGDAPPSAEPAEAP